MSKIERYEHYPPGMYGLPHMGEVIADHRVKAGWRSQETFAIVCGVDKQSVTYWENQMYLSDMERRIFLCKLLKIPPMLLGLTWGSIIENDNLDTFNQSSRKMSELLEENAYALYEDILIFAHTSTDKYSLESSYRFYRHQHELEKITKQASEIEKNAWQDLLSRYYQHSTFIAQHHKQDDLALVYANQAVDIASSINDRELLGASLYRRSRVHLIQDRLNLAQQDIIRSLDNTEKARGPLKGSAYLLAAEISALYAEGDEKLKTQCRKWQEKAANLIYKGKTEDDGTFLTFNLYAVHHERAKTLLRFALFHTSDDELVSHLNNNKIKAKGELLKEASNALLTARNNLPSSTIRKEMYLSITEARIHLIAREHEESVAAAKKALIFSRQSHSQQGIEEVKRHYVMLKKIDEKNPYICNLGIDLGIF